MSKIIDLSRYNTVTDWNKVRGQVDGVILRAGYRGYVSGKIVQDAKFTEHASACKNHGIPFGIYFMSQAITVAEAQEEAQYLITFAKQYGAALPLFMDSEDGDGTSRIVRADRLNKITRTTIARAFCNQIAVGKYKPGVYASQSWFMDNLDYDAVKQHHIWCARYGSNNGMPQIKPNLEKVDIWQYTSKGVVDGIDGYVDLNECYLPIAKLTTSASKTLYSEPKIQLKYSRKVLEWQNKMNIGFDGVDRLAEDGLFGEKSKAFAKKHLIYYGIKGSPTAVKWVQAVVGVKQDGIFGAKTLKAVRQYQKRNGLVADGVVGLATVTAILRQ